MNENIPKAMTAIINIARITDSKDSSLNFLFFRTDLTFISSLFIVPLELVNDSLRRNGNDNSTGGQIMLNYAHVNKQANL